MEQFNDNHAHLLEGLENPDAFVEIYNEIARQLNGLEAMLRVDEKYAALDIGGLVEVLKVNDTVRKFCLLPAVNACPDPEILKLRIYRIFDRVNRQDE